MKGSTVLVTGAARRLGREVSLALGHAGAVVVLHYNGSVEAARALQAEMVGLGMRAELLKADLSVPQVAEGLADRIWEDVGPLSAVVNNASIFPEGGLANLSWQDVDVNLRTNAWAPFALTRGLAARARADDRTGAVVNLLDSRIVGGDPKHAAYYLSKLMLTELTRMAALEYAPTLRVNGVAPGPILAPEGRDEAYLQRLGQRLPLRHGGTPAAIAEAVLYLLQADSVTGHVLFVDGGRHLKPESA